MFLESCGDSILILCTWLFWIWMKELVIFKELAMDDLNSLLEK